MLTRDTLKVVRADLDKALAQVAAKHGLKFTVGNIRFSSDSFRTTLNAAEVATPTQAATMLNASPALTRATETACKMHGMDPTKYYRLMDGTPVKVVDYVPRRPKFPFIVQTKTGRKYKVTAMHIKNMVTMGAV